MPGANALAVKRRPLEFAHVESLAGQSVVAIDLGGTQIRAGLITAGLNVDHRRAVATRDEDGVEAVIDRMCALVDDVLHAAPGAPVGIGISAPGPLDPWRGIVTSPPNLAHWVDVPLAERVEQATGLRTFLERDTNVAVGAEWRYGAARNARNAIYITVSTGIGGGLIIDGRAAFGSDGTAGEVGHLTIELDGPLCGDGMPGHVEAIGSGTAIARDARELLARGGSPRLAELIADGAEPDARLVALAADNGDEACRAILDRAWVAIGALCASLVNLLNPDVIVIGGSIARHQPELLEVARREIAHRAFAIPAKRARVLAAELGDDVSLIGLHPIVIERINDPAYRRMPGVAHPTPAKDQ
jgi:glucokinase